jgi:hypothetical protein
MAGGALGGVPQVDDFGRGFSRIFQKEAKILKNHSNEFKRLHADFPGFSKKILRKSPQGPDGEAAT